MIKLPAAAKGFAVAVSLMAQFVINCVTRRRRGTGGHEDITHLRGPQGTWAAKDVVTLVKSKTHKFYAAVGEYRHEIGAYPGRDGPLPRTHFGGMWNDTLLMLPPCPEVA